VGLSLAEKGVAPAETTYLHLLHKLIKQTAEKLDKMRDVGGRSCVSDDTCTVEVLIVTWY
jgi:hypothetical protein